MTDAPGDEHVTIIVPTRNESPNVAPLVARVTAALGFGTAGAPQVELLFMDDSDDDTPAEVARVAATSELSVAAIHRAEPVDGLGGAVVAGMAEARRRHPHGWVLVMDGDLQHPPEQLPRLIGAAFSSDADIVVGSRFVAGGSAEGLDGRFRVFLSHFSTRLTKALFPRRLADTTDPMSGLFLVRVDAIDLAHLHPRGFKILLEMLVRNALRVVEVPATLAPREAGESKADVRQAWRLTCQIVRLRLTNR